MKAKIESDVSQLHGVLSKLEDVEQEVLEKYSNAEERNREDHMEIWQERIDQIDEALDALRQAIECLEQMFP